VHVRVGEWHTPDVFAATVDESADPRVAFVPLQGFLREFSRKFDRLRREGGVVQSQIAAAAQRAAAVNS
jgi:hypothetical protein